MWRCLEFTDIYLVRPGQTTVDHVLCMLREVLIDLGLVLDLLREPLANLGPVLGAEVRVVVCAVELAPPGRAGATELVQLLHLRLRDELVLLSREEQYRRRSRDQRHCLGGVPPLAEQQVHEKRRQSREHVGNQARQREEGVLDDDTGDLMSVRQGI